MGGGVCGKGGGGGPSETGVEGCRGEVGRRVVDARQDIPLPSLPHLPFHWSVMSFAYLMRCCPLHI